MNCSIRPNAWIACCAFMVAWIAAGSAQAQDVSDREAVLAVNSEFYRAFRDSDMTAMGAVWGEREPIIVEHPSSWREVGRDRVLASWDIILRSSPAITCAVEDVTFTEVQATVHCTEQLGSGEVRMINVFHREGEIWRMIYHGPAADEMT